MKFLILHLFVEATIIVAFLDGIISNEDKKNNENGANLEAFHNLELLIGGMLEKNSEPTKEQLAQVKNGLKHVNEIALAKSMDENMNYSRYSTYIQESMSRACSFVEEFETGKDSNQRTIDDEYRKTRLHRVQRMIIDVQMELSHMMVEKNFSMIKRKLHELDPFIRVESTLTIEQMKKLAKFLDAKENPEGEHFSMTTIIRKMDPKKVGKALEDILGLIEKFEKHVESGKNSSYFRKNIIPFNQVKSELNSAIETEGILHKLAIVWSAMPKFIVEVSLDAMKNEFNAKLEEKSGIPQSLLMVYRIDISLNSDEWYLKNVTEQSTLSYQQKYDLKKRLKAVRRDAAEKFKSQKHSVLEKLDKLDEKLMRDIDRFHDELFGQSGHFDSMKRIEIVHSIMELYEAVYMELSSFEFWWDRYTMVQKLNNVKEAASNLLGGKMERKWPRDEDISLLEEMMEAKMVHNIIAEVKKGILKLLESS